MALEHQLTETLTQAMKAKDTRTAEGHGRGGGARPRPRAPRCPQDLRRKAGGPADRRHHEDPQGAGGRGRGQAHRRGAAEELVSDLDREVPFAQAKLPGWTSFSIWRSQAAQSKSRNPTRNCASASRRVPEPLQTFSWAAWSPRFFYFESRGGHHTP